MARYGTTKYGQRKYGASVTGILKWSVEIDWDQDLRFDGSNEARRMFYIDVKRGRTSKLKATGAGFYTIAPGICNIKLRNNDGRYDGWNQNSPLYPYVTYGPEVRIRVTNQATGERKDFFAGRIVDIRPYGYGGDAYVNIKIEDHGRFLRSFRARTPIATNLTPGQAIDAILNDVGWPSRWGRSIDVGTSTMNFHWASGSKLAWSEIEDVAQSFLGIFFIDASGQAVYKDWNTNPEPTMTLSQEDLLKDISNPQPFELRRNITRLKVHPRKEAVSGVIYQVNGDPLLVQAGGSRTVFANYTYNNVPVPARDVITPVATTDYLANTNSDGTGTNRTSDCSVTLTDFGDNAKLVFRNNSASNFYVTSRQIRGKAIYEENVDDVTYPEDPSTVSDPREFLLDLKWQQSVNIAEDYALVLGGFLDQLNKSPTVKMQGHPDKQFGMELFDAVALDLDEIGIIGESFHVGGLEHKSLSENCQDILTTISLEPYISSGNYWTWPIEDFGVDTIFGAG
jgi:hypothetical protein